MFFSQIRRAKTEIISADARQDAIAAGKSIDYVKLEERRVLNATFAFDLMAAELTLDNFTDSDAGLNNVALSQSGNNFVFTLGDGIWSEGGSVAGLDFTLSDGNRVLTINDASTSLSSILFNDNTADTFDISLGNLDFTIGSVTVTGNDGTFGQISESAGLSSGISIGNLSFACTSIDLSNATNDFGVVSGTATGDISLGDANDLQIPFLQTDNGSIAVAAAGQIDIDNSGAAGPAGLTVLDSADLDDPTSAITVVSLNGDVNILDAIQNNSGGEVFVVAAGTNSDVLVSDQIATENGAVQISAADQIRFTAESAIVAGGDSNVLISANLNGDGSGDDQGAVQMSDGSMIDAGTGTIAITNSGSDGGDVLLSEIRTANSSDLAVSITSAGGIFDATTGESANIFASEGGLRLTAIGAIGAEGDADIDTQVATLAFATQGRITLTDNADGLVIAGLGSLDSSLADGGAQITSHGLLAIRSDVQVGGNTEFTVTASANADDDILIGNLSVIRLDSATQATITLSAGDDIVFDTGSVVTLGHDAHRVNLIADTEFMVDGDVGSVTNTAGIAGVTIQTGRLAISSGDGIGDSSELPSNAPLRVNVDSIAASNSTNNGIRIAESDAIAVESLFNSGRLVELVAGSSILDGDGVPDSLDIDGGVVVITSTNGSVGSDTTDIFKGVFDPLEIRATLSLDMNAPSGLIVVDQLDEVALATLDAPSVVFYSDGDLDAIAGLSAVSLAADNLAFIADGDNDGLGTLTLPQSISVAGDLRIEGHAVLALDPMSNPVVAKLTASRLMFSSDTTVQVDTTAQQLDLEIDFAVDPAAQTAGQAVQINNSGSVQLVDLNCDGQSMIATDDDIKIVVAGDVHVQAAATLGDGALFIMANGNLSQLEQGIIAAAGLALAVDGQSLANAANDIDVLAADAGELIVLHDVDDLQVGAVTFGEGTSLEMTLSGIAALSDVKLSATDSLNFSAAASIDGNLFLQTLGPVTQTTDGAIVSQGLALMVGGPTLLDADNDITTLAATTDSQFVFHDVNDVIIDSVTVASGTAFEMTVNGLSAIDQQAKLTTGGNLVINAPFQFGSGSVFLSVGGNLTQSTDGIIVANALGLMVQGETVLASNNEVNVFAADNGGLTVFNNEGDLTVGTVAFAPATPLAMSVSGITTVSGDALLDVAGDLMIQQAIDTGSNHLVLTTDLAVEQSQSGSIFAASLGLITGGSATLLADNQVDVLAADTGGMLLTNNVTDLTIGTVTGAAGTPIEVTVSGVTTDGHDFKLTNSGRLSVQQMINAATGNIFLDVTGPLTQTAQGAMVAQGAGIANSSQVLLDAANDFDVFAADTMGLLVLNDTDDLIIGTVVVAAGTASEISASGIRTSNNDAKLTTGDDLGIAAAMELGTGNGLLSVSGSLSQATDGVINAAGLGLMVVGPTVLDAANDVDEIAASGGTDVLMFRDVDDLSISSVRVAAGTAFEMMVSGIDSVNQDIKLVVEGDLVVQDAVSFADGTFFLDVSGDVSQLDSGTVSGSELGFMIDGNLTWTANNDLDIVAGSSGGTFLLNDQDDLSVGTVTFASGTPLEMSAAGVITADADAKLVVAGDLDLDQAVQTGNGSLILTAGGDVRQASAGIIQADGLGLMVDGTTILDADNEIGTLALSNNGLTIVNNQRDLEIGSVTAFADSDFEMSLVGLIAADDVKMIVAGDLLVGESVVTPQNIFLSVEGDVSQTTAGTVSADGLGLMVGGSTMLDANNQVRLIAGSFGQSLVFHNSNDLTVGSVTVAAGTPLEMSAIGITTTEGFVKLGVTGDLYLNQFVDATGNDVFLTATGNISQNDTGIITAGGLGLMNEGSTILAADNQIDVLAGQVSGLAVFKNVADLEIGTITVAEGTGFEMSAVGLAAGGDIKLTVDGDLSIGQQITTESNVLLMVAGQASQTDSGTISADGLGLMVQGSTILAGANDVDVLAADNNGPLIFQDIDELATGTVTVAAGTPFEMTVVGISTEANDLKLAVAGNLNIAAAADVGAANLFLTVGGNLSQTASGIISAAGLGLMVDGNTVLNEDNQISVFAADNQGFTILNVTDNLTVGTVTVADNSPFAMTATGITTSNDDVKLNVAGNLQLQQFIDVGTGSVFLDVNANISQSMTGVVQSNGLATIAGGTTVLDADNAVQVYAGDHGNTLLLNNVTNLLIGTVYVVPDTAEAMTLSGITSDNDDVKILVDGNLSIAQSINSGTGNLFLQVTGDVVQTDTGTISSSGLGLMIFGATTLDSGNDVDTFAAATEDSLIFNDVDDLAIETVTVFQNTPREMTVSGIQTSDDPVKLIVAGDLQILRPVDLGQGDLLLSVDQNVLQSPSGTISAHGLALMVTGDSILNAANDVDVLAAAVTGFTVFNDIDDLTVGSVTVLAETPFEMTVAGIDSQDNEVKVQTGGDLLIVEQIDVGSAGIFLMVGGDASQDSSGTILADRLGIHVAGSMRLDAGNDVHELAADNGGFTLFNDIDDLVISRVTVAAGTAFEMSAVGVSTVDQDIKINCGGELLIDDPINSGNGNVLLSVDGPLSQTLVDPDGLDGTISCAGLGLMVSGPVDLSNPGNQIDRFAADVAGPVAFTNGSHLELASLTVDGMTIDCVDVLGDLELTIAGELTQSAAILVGGNAILDVSGNICLTGASCDADAWDGNDNDFMGTLNAFAGSSLEIADSNELTIGNLVAADQIRLRSGDGSTGGLTLNGSISTTAAGGHVLLQSDLGVYQDAALSVIDTENLMLGSSVDSDARSGDFLLLGSNTVERIAAELEDGLEFANRRDLEIAPLDFVSQCGLFTAEFDGLHVDSLVVNVTAGQATTGSLTDAANAVTVINRTAALNVVGDIVLGDGAASLNFTDHLIDQLLDQNVSTAYVSVAAAGNAGNPDGTDIASAANVSLYVDSTIILTDVNVSGLLFIDTIEGVSSNGSAGDVLQTMIADDTASSIQAETAVIVSNASIQLTNTVFVNVAVEANQQVSQLIMPFMINSHIGSTFTGSTDADVFTDPDAPPFVPGGTPGNPVDGVFDVEDAFLNDGFFSGNNAFINPGRVGAIIVNDQALNVVSIDSLGLDAMQLENIGNAGAAITTLGDVYLETRGDSGLHISADINVTTAISNLTVISGDELTLSDGAALRRINATEVVGLVNTIQHGFAFDQFILNNPRSVIEAPGNIAFSDLNAQLDSAVGFQNFDFYFGNPGETSFNLIVGWFINGVSASQAISPSFQASLLQEMSDLTGDFLLSDFGNFGQGISAYAIRLDNLIEGIDQPLSLTNISQFDQSFFAENPFWLSQIFLTNDARINLFADGGSTDLNFSQEVLPTQTVVQNPDFIVVDTPSFDVPVAPSNPPTATVSFVNLIPNPEPTPLTIEPLPESYYVVKYTADDDGIFEDEFKWEDPNDDPDAIRAAIEDATLNDDDDFWPETEDEETGNWTEKIKKGQVKPGLYYIFEVQEGQELEQPVDAPVDRTDLENLVQPEADPDISLFWKTETQYHDGEHTTVQPWTPWTTYVDDRAMEPWAPEPEEAGKMTVITLAKDDHHQLSDATRNASLGSSLLLARCLFRNRQTGKHRHESELTEPSASHDLFSRASRFRRQQQKRFG